MPLSKLTPTELHFTAQHLLSMVKTFIPEHPFIARQVIYLEQSLKNLLKINSMSRKSDYTKIIKELDTKIDAVLPLILMTLENNLKAEHYFPSKAKASKELLTLCKMRNRRQLLHGGYTSQASEITSLLKSIMAPSQDLNRIESGIDLMVQQLKETFEALQKSQIARLKEESYPTTQKEQGDILCFRLDNLLTYINANIIDEVEQFEKLKIPVNELITDVMSRVRSRYTKESHKK